MADFTDIKDFDLHTVGSTSQIAVQDDDGTGGRAYLNLANVLLGGNSVDNYLDLEEISDPGAPSATDARIYAGDDGSGNTVLATKSVGGIISTSTGASALRAIRSTSDTTDTRNALVLRHASDQAMAGNFGVAMYFELEDDAATANQVGLIQVRRDGADNSGRMQFKVADAGSFGTGMELDSDSRLSLAGHFDLAEISDPGAPAANTARIYAEDDGSGRTYAKIRGAGLKISRTGTGTDLLVETTDSNAVNFDMKANSGTDGSFVMTVDTNGRFTFFDNNLGQNVMRFDEFGNVRIGAGNPTELLHIDDGNVLMDNGNFTITQGNIALSNGYQDFAEMADPGAPAANTARIYAFDLSGATFLNLEGAGLQVLRDGVTATIVAETSTAHDANIVLKGNAGTRAAWNIATQSDGSLHLIDNLGTPNIMLNLDHVDGSTTARVRIGGGVPTLFRLTPMTTTQRDATAFTDGDICYNSTTQKFQGRTASAWVDFH